MPPVISEGKPAMACGLTPRQVMQSHPFLRLMSLPDILPGKSGRRPPRHAVRRPPRLLLLLCVWEGEGRVSLMCCLRP